MIEIIATSPEAALAIQAAGGNRIELISAWSEGGLTPSYGMIKQVVNLVDTPVNVMIRPHSRSFVYSNYELAAMKEDIVIAREMGANGVVLGTLTWDKQICIRSLEYLLAACQNLDITFHKAIDEVEDPVAAVALLSNYSQITTILTGGGTGSILDNLETIRAMSDAAGKIEIMPGGGLTGGNLGAVHAQVGASWYHLGSAVREGGMNGEISESRIRHIKAVLGV
ncbi:MAG: copper homeostasis protein CutC [Firmicutes bacterium]|nr:copper homeostasis protein CutC [Bacillota bacterium]